MFPSAIKALRSLAFVEMCLGFWDLLQHFCLLKYSKEKRSIGKQGYVTGDKKGKLQRLRGSRDERCSRDLQWTLFKSQTFEAQRNDTIISKLFLILMQQMCCAIQVENKSVLRNIFFLKS
ncbi:hypothetical protein AMECASPLE_013543 [Ameca splendens]|uniref:Uncharacterized protein n=1 Tax=Ameca splendens TaxID=208324 RepID=A0ABV0XQE0_9TELE